MLATHCRILNGQMQLGNPVELNIDRAGGANFVGGNRPIPTLLVVGRGKDGQMTLLSSEDMGMNPI